MTAAEFYSTWCFYCSKGHRDAATLRSHVFEHHAGSPRHQRYLEEDSSAT